MEMSSATISDSRSCASLALPRLLQTSIKDLLDEHRTAHEQKRLIPPWWVKQVERFALPPDRLSRPDYTPFVLSLIYWGLIFFTCVYQEGSIRVISLFVMTIIVGAVAWVAHHRKLEVTQEPKLALSWAILHLLIPFTSLFYSGRELYAWWLQNSSENRWTNTPWRVQDAVREIFQEFDNEIEVERTERTERTTFTDIKVLEQRYEAFARSFVTRCRTESPFLIEREGEKLRLRLIETYLDVIAAN